MFQRSQSNSSASNLLDCSSPFFMNSFTEDKIVSSFFSKFNSDNLLPSNIHLFEDLDSFYSILCGDNILSKIDFVYTKNLIDLMQSYNCFFNDSKLFSIIRFIPFIFQLPDKTLLSCFQFNFFDIVSNILQTLISLPDFTILFENSNFQMFFLIIESMSNNLQFKINATKSITHESVKRMNSILSSVNTRYINDFSPPVIRTYSAISKIFAEFTCFFNCPFETLRSIQFHYGQGWSFQKESKSHLVNLDRLKIVIDSLLFICQNASPDIIKDYLSSPIFIKCFLNYLSIDIEISGQLLNILSQVIYEPGGSVIVASEFPFDIKFDSSFSVSSIANTLRLIAILHFSLFDYHPSKFTLARFNSIMNEFSAHDEYYFQTAIELLSSSQIDFHSHESIVFLIAAVLRMNIDSCCKFFVSNLENLMPPIIEIFLTHTSLIDTQLSKAFLSIIDYCEKNGPLPNLFVTYLQQNGLEIFEDMDDDFSPYLFDLQKIVISEP